MASAELMDGSKLAALIIDGVRDRAGDLERRMGRRPYLATVLIGDDPASATYVQMKQELANTPCGRLYSRHTFPDRELHALITTIAPGIGRHAVTPDQRGWGAADRSVPWHSGHRDAESAKTLAAPRGRTRSPRGRT